MNSTRIAAIATVGALGALTVAATLSAQSGADAGRPRRAGRGDARRRQRHRRRVGPVHRGRPRPRPRHRAGERTGAGTPRHPRPRRRRVHADVRRGRQPPQPARAGCTVSTPVTCRTSPWTATATAGCSATVDSFTLSPGPTGAFDADGSSLVVHALPDDGVTQPTGGSGARVVCGVIVPAVAARTARSSAAVGVPAAVEHHRVVRQRRRRPDAGPPAVGVRRQAGEQRAALGGEVVADDRRQRRPQVVDRPRDLGARRRPARPSPPPASPVGVSDATLPRPVVGSVVTTTRSTRSRNPSDIACASFDTPLSRGSSATRRGCRSEHPQDVGAQRQGDGHLALDVDGEGHQHLGQQRRQLGVTIDGRAPGRWRHGPAAGRRLQDRQVAGQLEVDAAERRHQLGAQAVDGAGSEPSAPAALDLAGQRPPRIGRPASRGREPQHSSPSTVT